MPPIEQCYEYLNLNGRILLHSFITRTDVDVQYSKIYDKFNKDVYKCFFFKQK